jgi:hypothetical protein
VCPIIAFVKNLMSHTIRIFLNKGSKLQIHYRNDSWNQKCIHSSRVSLFFTTNVLNSDYTKYRAHITKFNSQGLPSWVLALLPGLNNFDNATQLSINIIFRW